MPAKQAYQIAQWGTKNQKRSTSPKNRYGNRSNHYNGGKQSDSDGRRRNEYSRSNDYSRSNYSGEKKQSSYGDGTRGYSDEGKRSRQEYGRNDGRGYSDGGKGSRYETRKGDDRAGNKNHRGDGQNRPAEEFGKDRGNDRARTDDRARTGRRDDKGGSRDHHLVQEPDSETGSDIDTEDTDLDSDLEDLRGLRDYDLGSDSEN